MYMCIILTTIYAHKLAVTTTFCLRPGKRSVYELRSVIFKFINTKQTRRNESQDEILYFVPTLFYIQLNVQKDYILIYFFNTFTLPLKKNKMYITQFQIEPIKRTDGIAFGSVYSAKTVSSLNHFFTISLMREGKEKTTVFIFFTCGCRVWFININIGDFYSKCETIIHITITHVINFNKIRVHNVTKYNKCYTYFSRCM